jgi:hypothetical protein
LIPWHAPERSWHARSYDGDSFGTIHHLFDDYVSDEHGYGARAAVGCGHGLSLPR